MPNYWVTGKTYPHKEYLKNKGAKWGKDRKCWKIELSGKQDENYMDLTTLGFKLKECEVQGE